MTKEQIHKEARAAGKKIGQMLGEWYISKLAKPHNPDILDEIKDLKAEVEEEIAVTIGDSMYRELRKR